MIQISDLVKRHELVASDSAFDSTCKRMFLDGKFNTDNWNGRDSVIRQFLMAIETYDIPRDYSVSVLGCPVSITCNLTYDDDDRLATVNVDKDVYYFGWYKNRGKTDCAKKNGNDMTEKDYVVLLNILELTGYKFNLTWVSK